MECAFLLDGIIAHTAYSQEHGQYLSSEEHSPQKMAATVEDSNDGNNFSEQIIKQNKERRYLPIKEI